MTATLDIAANDRETIRLFALDLSPPDAEAFVKKPGGNSGDWPLQAALGADHLDPAHVESFPVRDLTGVGLPAYLTEGLGIGAEDVAPDRARLEAETGHVVILYSQAFGGRPQTLAPRPPLRLLGTYRQAQPEQRLVALPTGPVEPFTAPTPDTAPAPPSRGVRLTGLVALLAAAIAVLALAYYIGGSP